MNKKIIRATKFSDKLMVYISGITKTLTVQGALTLEHLKQLFNKIQTYNSFPTPELYEEIEREINPANYVTKVGKDFIQNQDGKLMLRGSNVAMPDKLTDAIIEAIKNGENYEYLTNFWKLAILNPKETARDEMFKFLERNGMVITSNGYFISYKAVKTKNQLDEMDRFVALQYVEVRRKKDRDPSNYVVFEVDGKYELVHTAHSSYQTYSDLYEGWNLEEAYVDLINNELSTYKLTDKHSGKMDIRLGKPVRLSESEVDSNSDISCSRGLHVGSTSYVKGFASKGDTILICLVNPMHVRAVPTYDASKMRCTQYFPIGVTEFDENGEIKAVETSYFEDDYEEYTHAEIEKMLGNKEWGSDELKQVIRERVIKF